MKVHRTVRVGYQSFGRRLARPFLLLLLLLLFPSHVFIFSSVIVPGPSVLDVAPIRGHIAGSSPLPPSWPFDHDHAWHEYPSPTPNAASALHLFSREVLSATSLVDSRRMENTNPCCFADQVRWRSWLSPRTEANQAASENVELLYEQYDFICSAQGLAGVRTALDNIVVSWSPLYFFRVQRLKTTFWYVKRNKHTF